MPATRLLAAFIIPFLVAAAAILLLAPGETGRLFAWPISPDMSAMTLGSAYTAGIVFFSRVLLARDWDGVALGFPPVIAFASLLGIATFLHWDLFSHDNVAFWTWTALYVTTPFLVLAAFLRNLPAGEPGTGVPTMPDAWRVLFGVTGVATGIVAIALFVFPETLADHWPWTLSALTGRVISATFALPALLNIGIALNGRWKASRVPFEAQAVGLGLILLSYLRAMDDTTDDEVARWLFMIALAAMMALSVALYLYISRKGASTEV